MARGAGLLAVRVGADLVWNGLVLESGVRAWKPLQGVSPAAGTDGFLHAAMELDASDPASLPYADIAVDGTSASLSAEGLSVDATTGATVAYRVYEIPDLADPMRDAPVGNAAAPGQPVEIPLGGAGTGFFRIRVTISIE